MSDDAGVVLPSPSPHPVKKPRGRPKSPAKETPQQRVERAQAELHKAEQAHKESELNLASIVGKIVVNYARTGETFRHTLTSLLRSKIKNKADLATVAELLV